MNEGPINYTTEKQIANYYIKYFDLKEICQGGPEVGKVSINNKDILCKYDFGGPFYINGEFVYNTIFKRSIFGSGFILSRIKMSTLEIEELGKKEELIFLKSVNFNSIEYYVDLDKNEIKEYFFK